MSAFILRAGVVVVAVAAIAGCASMRRMDTNEAISARQKLMKEQGGLMRSMGEKAKAGQIQAIAADAAKLEDTAKRIPALFPQNSVDPSVSRAKPEIWQKWSEFEGHAKTLQTKADQLESTAKSGNAQATQAALADMGKTTCGACHTTFRGPEIKK
jgi:cytochrome c556